MHIRFFLATIVLIFGPASSIFTSEAVAGRLQSPDANIRTIFDGVSNPEQIARGQNAFDARCSGCHGLDLTGGRNSALRGPDFVEKWREYNLQLLYGFISNSMPPRRNENPLILPDDTYLDILAYIISGNGGQAGREELTEEQLSAVLFVGPEGPQPLPIGALAMVVGCLTRTPGSDWILTRTSRPVRSQTLPFDATTEELISAESIPLGSETFGLLDMAFVRGFDPADHEAHKVQAKGLMIRTSEGQSLSLTTMGMVSAECTE